MPSYFYATTFLTFCFEMFVPIKKKFIIQYYSVSPSPSNLPSFSFIPCNPNQKWHAPSFLNPHHIPFRFSQPFCANLLPIHFYPCFHAFFVVHQNGVAKEKGKAVGCLKAAGSSREHSFPFAHQPLIKKMGAGECGSRRVDLPVLIESSGAAQGEEEMWGGGWKKRAVGNAERIHRGWGFKEGWGEPKGKKPGVGGGDWKEDAPKGSRGVGCRCH